jgi:hemolysin activation/secretion protein
MVIAASGLVLIGASELCCGAPPDAVAPAGDSESERGTQVFDVLELRVLGNTVLDARTIETVVYPFTGPGKRIADVEAARTALESAYHEKGFGAVFVDIPEQSVDEGVVRLHVTEGRLRQVRVTGERYFSARDIRAALPAAQPGGVPNLPELQRELTALNRQTPDRVVVPVMKAGPLPGTVDLALRTEDHLPFHGSVELNNQHTVDTKPLRVAVAASYDNMFGRLDSLGLQYQWAPQAPAESHVFAGSYALRLDADSRLSITYIDSKSDVATVGTLGILGTGTDIGLRWLRTLPATGWAHSVALGIDYKDFQQGILVTTSNEVSTPVQYWNLSASYSGAKGTTHEQWDWTTILNLGVRGVRDNEVQFANKRYNAQANYAYLRADGGWTVQLPVHFSATWRLTGQLAVEPLISNEQLAVGGAASVRGYLEAEELGDSAIRSSWQVGGPPLSFGAGRLHFNEYIFYDLGYTTTIDALPGEPVHADLRSTGAGMSFDAFGHAYGSLTWAYPLATATETQRGSSTWLFVVRSTW